ncbi:MAG: sigma-70 family RNA polymerase sigma factor [Burkholderiales bacterium]|nr:sigma-70 family RNA polymerase sigma factor [Burkholderiales bacterium]
MNALADEDDTTLVARCRRGEAAAWEALVRRYQRLVYAIVRRAGLDEHAAADVFQTVFARLVEHLPRIADPRRLQAWNVTTARREVILALRRGQRTVSMTRADDDGDDTAEFDVADEALLPEEALDELQQLDGLRRALDRLDQRCRELLQLLFRDEDDKVPYEEVAQRLGVSVGSIGPTRSRCLGKLRGLVDAGSAKA